MNEQEVRALRSVEQFDAAEEWIGEACSRETSREIMAAIVRVAGGSPEEAARIWSSPTEAELAAIGEIATRNGQIPADSLCWGAEGTAWAEIYSA